MQARGKKLCIIFGGTILGIALIGGIMIKKQSAAKIKQRDIKVGMTLYNANDVFIKNTCDYLKEYIRELNEEKEMNIQFEAIDSKHSQELQNRQIDTFIKEEYDIIIANTVEREEASTIIDKAHLAGFPLIFFNREPVPQDMQKWDKIYYVGSSAQQAGTLQGEILAGAIEKGLEVDKNKDGKLQYVMIEGEYGHQDAILRTYHCIRELEGRGFIMENLATDTGMWRKEKGKDKMTEWLNIYGDQIEVVMANNDEMALGAIEALKAYGYFKDGKTIPVVGVDGISEAIEAIEKGEMIGTVFNDSAEQARCIVSKIYELITGERDGYPVETEEEANYFWVDHKKMTK